ncbi:hypothetical protein [Chroococcus sp. FPU101]|uniref:DUF4760 domain-containing protein n=1 Tax=Chroococcus sp. FPU101 TaxID=1974212 RepID=UPI001A8BF780|nr:hypothetical protein [Chroococcus sp. FPU101]GFE71062.1 hypothetical protein CFPU101_36720 [Chroococcus sp. FPU101]
MLKSHKKIRSQTFLLFSDEKVSQYSKIVKSVISLITSMGFIPAGLYTLHEYNKQQQNRREDRTLELHAKQFEEPLSAIHSDLNFVFSHPNVKPQDVNIEEIKKYNFEFRKDIDKFKKMMILLEYYEGVAKCVKIKNCEENTTKALFKEDVRNFIVWFSPLLCDLRKKSLEPDIASDLEEFVKPKNPLCNKDNSYGK